MIENSKVIWKNGEFLPWESATTHVLTHGLHYGSAVFEGMRYYQTDQGPALFKLIPHMERMIYSAKCIGLEIPYSIDELVQATVDTVRKNGLTSGYIRHLAYYGEGPLRIAPADELSRDLIIATWPWGKYLAAQAVDVKTSQYIRIHPKSTRADAKISGHYVNSILAGLEIKNTHYHESLLLDEKGQVAEGTSCNIFIIKNGELYTTPLGTILAGITRDTVIKLAKKLGYTVHEEYFKPEDVINADEAFFVGTAVEVTGINSLDDQIVGHQSSDLSNSSHSNLNPGPITQNIAKAYHDVVTGKDPDFQSDLTFV